MVAPASASVAALASAVALVVAAADAGAQRSQDPRRWPGPGEAAPTARFIDCPEDLEAPESVCRVDASTYVGWRVFEAHCAACHGPDALGSSFAPSLVHRMSRFDRRAFFAALDNGYFGRTTGMEPWGDDPDVARYYDELWSYLSARVDGQLPAVALVPRREESVEP